MVFKRKAIRSVHNPEIQTALSECSGVILSALKKHSPADDNAKLSAQCVLNLTFLLFFMTGIKETKES